MNPRAIAKLFSRKALRQLSDEKGLPAFRALVLESGLAPDVGPDEVTIGDILDKGFELLVENYRNEYIYKNLIANQLMLERHAPGEAVLLSEFRAYTSMADLVILNGTSSVYEIKTELDNLNRLDKQLNDYSKIFDLVNVVTHHSCVAPLLAKLPPSVGLITLESGGKLQTVRDPSSNIASLSAEAIFYSLRQNEYEGILIALDGELPSATPALMMRACAQRFAELSAPVVHSMMVGCLKQRDRLHRRDLYSRSLPKATAHFALSTQLTRKASLQFIRSMSLPALYQ